MRNLLRLEDYRKSSKQNSTQTSPTNPSSGSKQTGHSIIPFKRFIEISMNTTFFRSIKPCVECGEERFIYSGLPTTLNVRIPLTDDEHRWSSKRVFFIAGDFSYICLNGASHIAKGIDPKNKWKLSTHESWNEGYVEEGVGFEQTLAKFLPTFVDMLKKNQLDDRPRLGS